jgi:hypothetical protein
MVEKNLIRVVLDVFYVENFVKLTPSYDTRHKDILLFTPIIF